MSLVCTECEGYVYKQGAAVITAELKKGKVKEGPGYVICFSHASKVRKKLHSLDDLIDGKIFIVDQRIGYQHNSGTLAWSEPLPRVKILGYLKSSEAKKYFPNTYKMLAPSR